MAAYNIYEAKTAFSSLAGRVERGETITVSRAGKPIMRMVPILPETPVREASAKRRRPAPGSMSADWNIDELLRLLDEPWSEEEQRAFGMID